MCCQGTSSPLWLVEPDWPQNSVTLFLSQLSSLMDWEKEKVSGLGLRGLLCQSTILLMRKRRPQRDTCKVFQGAGERVETWIQGSDCSLFLIVVIEVMCGPAFFSSLQILIICYVLNVCLPPKFVCCNWVPSVIILRGGNFGRWLGDWVNGIRTLTRRPEAACFPLLPREDT